LKVKESRLSKGNRKKTSKGGSSPPRDNKEESKVLEKEEDCEKESKAKELRNHKRESGNRSQEYDKEKIRNIKR